MKKFISLFVAAILALASCNKDDTEPIRVGEVKLSKTTLILAIGEKETLTATVLPDNAEDKTVAWSSSDTKVAVVDDNGTVTAVAPGPAIITASAGEKSANCLVTVKEPIQVSEVELNKTTLNLTIGDEETLTATVLPDNADDKTVAWSSSDTTIAMVDDNGKVTAVAPGSATITASADEKSANCLLTVIESAKIGDIFYSDGSYSTTYDPSKTPIGIVFLTDPERIGEGEREALRAKGINTPHGLVVSLKQAADRELFSINGGEDGLTRCLKKEQIKNNISGYGNCMIIKNKNGNYDNHPIFKATEEFNNIVPPPANTTGWFLPAVGQMYDFLHNMANLPDWDEVEDGFVLVWEGQEGFLERLNAKMSEIPDNHKDEYRLERNYFGFSTSSVYTDDTYSRVWEYDPTQETVQCAYRHKTMPQYTVRAVLAF